MFLNEDFIRLFEELDSLNEAKADTQRLIDFAGEDLANRFLAIKDRLKAPENDLYYWIKNKTVEELEAAVAEVENTKSKSQIKKDIADQGAELVCDSEHWTVHHITTFEASQKYGRDSQWCITGVNNYGDKYWKDYRDRNIEFYFLNAKQDYNARGEDSKFAIALYPNGNVEIFNQRDIQISSIDEIPYYEEVSINGNSLDSFDLEGEYWYCVNCDCELDEDTVCWGSDGDAYCDVCWSDHFYICDYCGETTELDDGYTLPNGDMICDRCFNNSDYVFCPECGEIVAIDDIIRTIFDDEMCYDCYDGFLDTDRGYAEMFSHRCEGYSEGDFSNEAEVNKMINCWNRYKIDSRYSEEEIEQYEKDFIENALAADKVVIDPERFIEYADEDDDYISSYYISVEGTDKEQENYQIKDSQALKEIITFINLLDQSEKDRVRMSWDWVDDDGDFGDLVVSIYGPSDGEAYEERTISNWERAENLIRKALGLDPK